MRRKTNIFLSSCNLIETTKLSSSKRRGTEKDVTAEKIFTDNDQIEQKRVFTMKKCYWKSKAPNSKWQERIVLGDLKIGQELSGYLVEELLEGKTGPKLFFECGVGRTNPKSGNWSIVNGMLRLDRGKISVARKRAARFRKKNNILLYVSRIQIECGRLEVTTTPKDLQKYTSMTPKISISSLKKKQVVTGEVLKLYPYGAIIDIGANRKGLLHIKKVANLMNQYIEKEKGLKDAGLEKGAKVKLMVESIEKRNLSLDFTDDVKEDAREELKMDQKSVNDVNSINEDELASWKAYVQENYNDEEDGNDHDEYEYDEDAEIESAVGLDII